MPLRLNVGLSKKIGQRDYGSLAAFCNVELELAGDLIQHDLDTFHRHVKNAYLACAQAVNDELARHTGHGKPPNDTSPPPAAPNENGHNGTTTPNHRATQKQFDYARQLAGQIKGLGVRKLETLAGQMFSKPFADLTSLEASGIIDVLKDIKAGKIETETALNGTQPA